MTLTVTKILEELSATSSKNEKQSLLEMNKDNVLLQLAFKLAYDPAYNFYLKKIPSYSKDCSENATMLLSTCLSLLVENICSRKVTGEAAKIFIKEVIEKCEEPVTLIKIIKRDLECGASTTLANKVWPKLILDPPYMGYKLFSLDLLKKFKLPCFSQVKQDGLYCDLFVNKDSVFYRSRSGIELNFNLPKHIENILIENFVGFVIHCEALVINKEKPLGVEDRQTGNGYLNSDGTDSSLVTIRAWDIVTQSEYSERVSNIEYEQRWDLLNKLIALSTEWDPSFKTHVDVVDSEWCETADDVIRHFVKCRKLKLEGTVIKNPKMPWKDGKTTKGLKLKNEFDFEVKIVGVQTHSKKDDWVGSYFYESSDGVVKGKVGAGLSDKDRQNPLPLGAIVTCKGNDLTESESREEGEWSVFLARFIEPRFDKKVANTYEEILEASESFTQLLAETLK